MSKRKVYRATKSKDNLGKLLLPHNTMRPPGNVPYIVDNLWEWARPDKYPNRRFSAFACPDPKLAIEAAGSGCIAYQVEFDGDFKKTKLCQLVGSGKVPKPQDSKFHYECKELKKRIIEKLPKNCFENDVSELKEIAPLWMPCLRKEEVEYLFRNVPELIDIRVDILDSINYWNDISLIEDIDNIPDSEGEMFFEYPDGYFLREF